MRYRKLDSNGDYVFGHGAADFHVNSPACVAQSIQTRLRLLFGEWFLDTTQGVDYLGKILGAHTQATRDQAIKDCITATSGVTAILSYSSSLDPVTRAFNVAATVDTIYGTTTVTA